MLVSIEIRIMHRKLKDCLEQNYEKLKSWSMCINIFEKFIHKLFWNQMCISLLLQIYWTLMPKIN